MIEFSDAQFIDPAVSASAGANPASITNGVSPTVSTGNAAKDLAALIASFTGDLERCYLVTDPVTAAQIALSRDSNGAFLFPDIGPRGGSVLGIPVLTSRGVPRPLAGSPTVARGLLILVDPAGIVVGEGGIEADVSTQATLVMDSAPAMTSTGIGASPTAPVAANTVSLYQADAVAVRCIRTITWLKARSKRRVAHQRRHVHPGVSGAMSESDIQKPVDVTPPNDKDLLPITRGELRHALELVQRLLVVKVGVVTKRLDALETNSKVQAVLRDDSGRVSGMVSGSLNAQHLAAEVAQLRASVGELTKRLEASETAARHFKYVGVWKEGVSYRRNNFTTFNGALWCATDDQPVGKPGTAGWQLCVKRGAHSPP